MPGCLPIWELGDRFWVIFGQAVDYVDLPLFRFRLLAVIVFRSIRGSLRSFGHAESGIIFI